MDSTGDPPVSKGRMVITRREELKNDPAQVAAAQALTLDSRRPFGLKGTFGLFGSAEWWQDIERGIAPVTHMHGVISKVYAEGMHNEGTSPRNIQRHQGGAMP